MVMILTFLFFCFVVVAAAVVFQENLNLTHFGTVLLGQRGYLSALPSRSLPVHP